MSDYLHHTRKFKIHITVAIVSGVLAFFLTGVLCVMFLMISFYNMTCGGQSCDGSTFSRCTPSSAPGLFIFLFVGMVVAIGLTITCIINIVKTVQNRRLVEYYPASVPLRTEYVNEFRSYKKRQVVFTVFAGIFGGFVAIVLLMVQVLTTISILESSSGLAVDPESVVSFIITLLLFATPAIVFLVLAINSAKKKKAAVDKAARPMGEYNSRWKQF